MDKKGLIQSIDRAICVLKCFTKGKKEMRLSEIADELDLNKSTVHGIVTTLKYHGLINQDDDSRKYRLGLYLLELGNIVSNSLKIRELASPYLKDLSLELGETVHLGELEGSDVVYLDKHESCQSMRIVTDIGTRLPAYCTGLGKAMLAYLDEETLLNKIPGVLQKFTEQTITDRDELLLKLKEIREDGISFDNQEYDVGLSCIAAPIFDSSGKAKYAISTSVPSIRMTDEKIEDATNLIKKAAREISYELGFIE